METLLLAMWPIWVALAATAVIAVLEHRDQLDRDIDIDIDRILNHDFDTWDFEIHVDQALRLANREGDLS